MPIFPFGSDCSYIRNRHRNKSALFLNLTYLHSNFFLLVIKTCQTHA